jgi:hypothetical protein
MQYIPVKFNKYTNGIYNPPPNYNVNNPDFWSAGILSPEVNSRLAHGLANLGKRYEPQLRYVNAIMSQPIKPSKKSIPRDSIFANFGMIGSQPYTRDHEPERVQQEQQAGLVPVKTGGARRRKKLRIKRSQATKPKVKRGGARKKRVARKGVPLNKRR